MQFELSVNPLDQISGDAILIFAYQTERHPKLFSGFNKLSIKLQSDLTKAIETARFTAKRGETLDFYVQRDSLVKSVIVLGLGKKEEFVVDDLRRAVGVLSQKKRDKLASIALELPGESEIPTSKEEAAGIIVEGFMLGGYEFDRYKAKDKDNKILSTIIISEKNSDLVKNSIKKAEIYCRATFLARDLVNEQAAVATPTYLADLAVGIAKKDPKHIFCKVLDRKEAERSGMEAFLGVARASDTEPKFIHLEYRPDKKSKRKLALVGKGITFDSGGINVKTGDGMIDMKMDMSGAAIVLGVFSVISGIKPDFSVMGIIAATPNMVSGNSLVPGDVVRALNGKTIEILNTDAEGRVTMADSLSFAIKNGASEVIDFATLTGACMVALGTDIAGLFSNNRELAERIKRAAFDAGEKVWELPLEKDYRELNKSEVADIANIPNTRYGGAITAALFLQEFVKDLPWAHLDIAGPAFSAKATDLSPKGGTGHGVRTVLNLLI